MVVGGVALEGAAKGTEERQKLGNGGQGALSEEGELQAVCGRFLIQAIRCLEKQQDNIIRPTKLQINKDII